MPLLDPLDIDGTVITADALLTQVKFARYLVEDKKVHYHFTVKANQPNDYLNFPYVGQAFPVSAMPIWAGSL